MSAVIGAAVGAAAASGGGSGGLGELAFWLGVVACFGVLILIEKRGYISFEFVFVLSIPLSGISGAVFVGLFNLAGWLA